MSHVTCRPARHRAARSMIVGLSLALALAACSGGNGSETGPEGAPVAAGEQSTTLAVGFPQEPPDWDYVQNPATAIKALIVHNVVEPLVEKMEDGSFEPLLAESFEASDDGLQYTFTIAEATFHDGSELSADDVVYSLEYNRGSPHGEVSVPFEAVEAIEKVDDRTVQVTLSRPSQRFLEGMSQNSGLIIPEGSADDLGQGPVGTGPFVFEEWRNGVEVRLTRFDDYWGEAPSFERVSWRFFTDETASLNALLAGDVDLVTYIVGEGIDRVGSVDETPGFTLATAPWSEISYVSLNAEQGVFDDERVRQAIAHAIDREALIEGSVSGFGQPTCVFVNPPEVDWNSDHCPYPYDPDRARELLAEAGAEDLTIQYKFLQYASFPPAMEILTALLEDVGITVETQGREFATYLDEVISEQPDYQLTHIAGPQQIDSWVCPGWFTQDCVPEFDELLAEADATIDREEWAGLRRQAVELHADRAYLIPVMNHDNVSAMREDLVGLKPYMSASEVDLRFLRWAE